MKLNLQYFAELFQQESTDDNPPIVEEKTFTQEDVNRIIGERLAKDRAKAEADFAQREQELKQREFRMKAKELLAEKDWPETFFDALNTKDEETLKNSIQIVDKYIQKRLDERLIFTGPGIQRNAETDWQYDNIRKAMNL